MTVRNKPWLPALAILFLGTALYASPGLFLTSSTLTVAVGIRAG